MISSVKSVVNGLCQQAQIYFWVAVIVNVLVFLRSFDVNILVMSAIWIPAWTWIVNKLCKNNYAILAWVFGLFPIAGILITLGMNLVSCSASAVKATVDEATREPEVKSSESSDEGFSVY